MIKNSKSFNILCSVVIHLKMIYMEFRQILLGSLLILAVISITSCQIFTNSQNERIIQSRERILRDNLYQIRKLIKRYKEDTGSLPTSLDDFVDNGYLREVPTDPMTEKKDWRLTLAEDTRSMKQRKGIVDIHSSSTKISLEGTPYTDW